MKSTLLKIKCDECDFWNPNAQTIKMHFSRLHYKNVSCGMGLGKKFERKKFESPKKLNFFPLRLFSSKMFLVLMEAEVLQQWDHKGPYGTIQDHTEPYGTIRDHTRPYGTIWDQKGPYGTIHQKGPYTIRDHTRPNETRRDHTEPFGTIWDQKGPKQTIREYTVPNGTIRYHKGPYGTIGNHMGP